MSVYKPVVLIILDGWGESMEEIGNPFKTISLPTVEKLNKFYPKILLEASGLSVGVPWGDVGNSDVGHQALGSGQIKYQNLPRINLAIESGAFFDNTAIISSMQRSKKMKKSFHIMGLLSNGSVHSHINHFLATLQIAKEQGLKNVYLHIITDGRDTAPDSSLIFIKQLEDKIKKTGLGEIATISGRHYSMDRNENWDRTEKAYLAMTQGIGIRTTNFKELLKQAHIENISDEHLEPIVVTDKNNVPIGSIADDDSIIFTNFRSDRAKQITQAFTDNSFNKFSPATKLKKVHFISMIQYDDDLKTDGIAFPPEDISITLGKLLSQNNKHQLRLAETEKYAHVTYFFNGGKEDPYPNEDRIVIPSKAVSSYDQLPEMSSREVTNILLEKINEATYDFILVNYAAADMVGHTGNQEACLKALSCIDECLKKIIPTVLSNNGCMLITADHGNIEELIHPKTGARITEHSANPVPLWYITPDNHRQKTEDEMIAFSQGLLCDVAPTILEIMQLPKPSEMTCTSLLPMLL
jgi:2,3-bisphosphoglycerate-independent phosphoglycerate mutase